MSCKQVRARNANSQLTTVFKQHESSMIFEYGFHSFDHGLKKQCPFPNNYARFRDNLGIIFYITPIKVMLRSIIKRF